MSAMVVAPDRRTELTQRIVLAAYVVLAATPFVFAATHAWFWNHRHARAPIAAEVVGILLVALAFRRSLAWLMLVLFYCSVVISYAWEWAGALPFVLNVTAFALLVSPAMRRYVGLGELRAPRFGKPSRT